MGGGINTVRRGTFTTILLRDENHKRKPSIFPESNGLDNMIQNCASARIFLAGDFILKYPLFLPNCCFRGIPMLHLHAVIIIIFFLIWKYWRANVSEMLLKEMLLQTTI